MLINTRLFSRSIAALILALSASTSLGDELPRFCVCVGLGDDAEMEAVAVLCDNQGITNFSRNTVRSPKVGERYQVDRTTGILASEPCNAVIDGTAVCLATATDTTLAHMSTSEEPLACVLSGKFAVKK